MKIKTKEELEKEVRELYPNLERYNSIRTFFRDGYAVKDLFGYLWLPYYKEYKFYYVKKPKHKFSILDKHNRTKDPNEIFKIIKTIKNKERYG